MTALIRDHQTPCKHLLEVVLRATSQRFPEVQREFFVATAYDSPEVTFVIECVLSLFFKFQVMSDVPVQCMCLVLCSHPACCQLLTVYFSCGQTSAVDNSHFNLLTLLT